MLDQLIKAIKTGDSFSISGLAARLEIEPEMVIVMLEYLERAGYIEQVGACTHPCNGCHFAGGCIQSEGLPGKVWIWGG